MQEDPARAKRARGSCASSAANVAERKCGKHHAVSESVASIMQSLKGGTARVLRAEFPDLEEFLWGESFWGDGYFAETVGQAEEAIVRAYNSPCLHSQPAFAQTA